MFGVAAVMVTVSIFLVAYVTDPVAVVVLLSATLFFLRWCGMYWAISSALAGRDKSGFLGGCMNLGGNIAGITTPLIVGFIVQATGSYFLALMYFAARRRCALDLLDPDRLQPQTAGLESIGGAAMTALARS